MDNRETLPDSGFHGLEGNRSPQISDHEVLGYIGSGGFKRVWLARTIIGQYRAVAVVSRKSLRHFEKESAGLRKFEPISRSHEGFVHILHVGKTAQGDLYYIMQLADDQVAGRNIVPDSYAAKTLRSELRSRRRFPVDECVQVGLSLIIALEHLHKQGLVHRDIKPDNILYIDGVPKLADIGLVADAGQITFVGTEGFIPPEGPGKPQADLYGFGKVLYEISTGKDRLDFPEPPFCSGESPDHEKLLQLNEVISKACEPDVRKRYQTAGEMLADLTFLKQGKKLVIPTARKPVRRNNLPAQLTSFIGREKQMAQIRKLLQTTRLLVLTGSGGCGKTRLALQVAADLLDEYPDGAWFVDLAALSETDLVPQTVATVLGVREEPGQPLTCTLSNHLRSKNLLLVLDNCEHLVSACALLAEALLRACPDLRILATSRERLGVAGEMTYGVPPLSMPDVRRLSSSGAEVLSILREYEAVRLFVERAVLSRPQFQLKAMNWMYVALVCHRLDGIPLAIELAAARMNALTVQQMATQLNERFEVLTGGSRGTLPRKQSWREFQFSREEAFEPILTGGKRGALPRQKTLRATIEWSYDLLSDSEQLMFRRLSVFAGGWTLEAAEVVCAAKGIESGNIPNLLTRLVDQSLVTAEEHDGAMRYRMLETLRQYAREKLMERGPAELNRLRKRHLDFFLELAERAEPNVEGPESHVWLDRLEVEQDNLRAALESSLSTSDNSESALRLASALGEFWLRREFSGEGRRWLEAALRESAGASRAARAKALRWAGELARLPGDFAGSRSFFEQALAIFRESNDRIGISRSLRGLGFVALNTDNIAAARSLMEESLVIARELGNKAGIADLLHSLGNVALNGGDNALARSRYQEALEIERELGNKSGVAVVCRGLGWVAIAQGEFALARSLLEQVLAIRRELKDGGDIARALIGVAEVTLRQNDFEKARTLVEESLALSRECGRTQMIACSLGELGRVALYQSDYERARSLFDEGQAMLEKSGDKWGLAFGCLDLARVARKQGNYAVARAYLGNGLVTARAIGHKWCISHVLLLMGSVARDEGDYPKAQSFCEQSLAIYRELNAKCDIAESLGKLGETAKEQGDYQRAVALCQEDLSLNREMGAKLEIAASLERLAGVHGAQGQAERAARLFGAAGALRETIGAPIHPCDCEEYDENVAPVRAALSADAFSSAWAEGRAMTMEQAVAYALENPASE